MKNVARERMILKRRQRGVSHVCLYHQKFQVSSGRWFGRLINFKGGMVLVLN